MKSITHRFVEYPTAVAAMFCVAITLSYGPQVSAQCAVSYDYPKAFDPVIPPSGDGDIEYHYIYSCNSVGGVDCSYAVGDLWGITEESWSLNGVPQGGRGSGDIHHGYLADCCAIADELHWHQTRSWTNTDLGTFDPPGDNPNNPDYFQGYTYFSARSGATGRACYATFQSITNRSVGPSGELLAEVVITFGDPPRICLYDYAMRCIGGCLYRSSGFGRYYTVDAWIKQGESPPTGPWPPVPPPGRIRINPPDPLLAAGMYHNVAVKTNGTVWTWGWNINGQLGDGTTTQRNSPVQIGISNLVAVSAGGYHCLALKNDGTVWAWGGNSSGQLGDGTTTQQTTPIQTSVTNVVAISAGRYSSSYAVKTDGSVWAWGHNLFGQLGDGTKTGRTTPVQTLGLSNVVSVAGGLDYGLALKIDGTVWAWGANSRGQLGDGTTTERLTAVMTTNISEVVAVSAGYYGSSYALRSDGTLWAWGYNADGQLGDGTTSNRLAPVLISGITNVVAVSAGYGHCVAVKADGSVWAWGVNTSGQLGDGTTTRRLIPTFVGNMSATAVSGGAQHSLSKLADFSLRSWGMGANGQLGDGSNVQRLTPVSVIGF